MEIAKLFNALPSAGSQGVIWGIMAIGVYITYRILDVADLTVDGSIATGGAVAAVLIIGGCNVWVAMVAAFLVGMLAGLATGIFHTFMGIPAILAGILTQLSLYSINLRILGGKANMAVSVNNYPLLVSARNARVLSLSNPIFILAALAVAVIALLYWFFGTERGCSLRATGANANMARAQGINTNADKVLGLMLSNGLVAFSGALLTQYQGFVDVGMGRGAIVIGLAAVIIGEVVFSKIFHNFALKLLAVAKEEDGEIQARVHPTFVPNSHPLANVNDAFNAVFVKGHACGEMMFYGRGAGDLPTASALVSDLICAAKAKRHELPAVSEAPCRMAEDWCCVHFVRMRAKDEPGVLSLITGGFAAEGVSIASMVQKGERDEAGFVQLIFLTHRAGEHAVRRALAKMDPVQASAESVIRVEE